uniref:HNH endonuclease n=1 Tax=viral metagenome TaxID=1070528 RepID=A0A6C0IGX0_9ZZZZ
MDESNNEKKITFVGQNNRYQMKKVMKEEKKNKIRVETEKWSNLDKIILTVEKQVELIKKIRENNYTSYNEESRVMCQQLERKISGYKQQDVDKKVLDLEKLLNLKNVIDKLIDCELNCYYCLSKMYLLYEIVREGKQWTVDRIDNDLGHNNDNFVVACLECNLKRRCRTKEKFLFTQQLCIVKKE